MLFRPGAEGGTRLRTALRLAIGIGVSLACLYLATRSTDWSRVGDVLRRVRPGWALAALTASTAVIYIRTQRWRILLRPMGDVPLYPALSATAIGFGASAVLPFRVGEIIRPALLSRHVGVSLSATLASVVLERIFDTMLVISCFIGVSLVYPMRPALERGAHVLGALTAMGTGVLFLAQRHRQPAERFAARILDGLPSVLARRLRPVVASFLLALGVLGDGAVLARVLAYSVFLWGTIQLTFLFAFLALDIQVPLVTASLTTMVVVAAFVFLPQAPGFVGTWQAGCVLALGLFFVPGEEAVGYSLLTWIVSMVSNLVAGGIFLAREDISARQMLRLGQTAPAAEG